MIEKGKPAPKTIDEYIAACPEDVRPTLERIRTVIREAAPSATERISYRIPAFWLDGDLVYFAAFTRHIGFYPTSSGIETFKDRFGAYRFSKGAVQFPIGEEPPYALISEIVRFRVEENMRKAAAKRTGPKGQGRRISA